MLWTQACQTLGVNHIYPQANNMVERIHRHLKNSLKARLAAAEWQEHLTWVLLGAVLRPQGG